MKIKTFILTFLMMMSCSISFGQELLTGEAKTESKLKQFLFNDEYGTITIGDDFSVSSTIEIPKGRKITIDLKGHKLTTNADIYIFKNFGRLTITDNSTDGKGTISSLGIYNGKPQTRTNTDDIDYTAQLTIKGGVFENISQDGGAAIYNHLGVIDIQGGEFYGEYSAITNFGLATIANAYIECLNRDNGAAAIINDFEIEYGNNVNVVGRYTDSETASITDGKATYLFAELNGTKYPSLQAALDACTTGDNTINLLFHNSDNATVSQKEGVNITIVGNGYKGKRFEYTGTIYVNGNSRHTGAETLTIQDVDFYTEKNTHDFISCNDGGNSVIRYAHNVTVQNCNFNAKETSEEVVALRFRQSYNINVKDSEFTNLHSAMWATGTSGIAFDNIKATNCKEGGISVATSTPVSVKNSTIKGAKYGVRADGSGAYSLTVENSTLEAEVPVIVRNTTGEYNLTVKEDATLTANGGPQVVVTAKSDSDPYVVPTSKVNVTLYDNVTSTFGLTAKIGNAFYATLQDAVDNAKTSEIVTLIADNCKEDVTVNQAPNYAITIDGAEKTFKGTITVDGKSARYETTALTIENVNFDATEGITYDACVRLGNDTNATRYTNSVTVKDCTFSGNGVVAVKSYTGGDWNLKIEGCTVNAGMHSLAQVDNIEKGLEITGCEVYSKNGINLNNSGSTDVIKIKNNIVDVKGYAVRIGVNGTPGTNAQDVVLANNTLKSACDDADAVIMFRGTATKANFSMEKNVVSGTTHISGNTAATNISADANYWDGKEAPVVAEGSAPIVVNSYYSDATLSTLVRNEMGSINAFVSNDCITGDVTTNAEESIKIEIIGKDGNVIGTSSLEKTEHATGFNNTLTWRINLGADDSGSWAMAWHEGAPSINNMPAKVKLYVDAKEGDAAVAEAEIRYTADGDGRSPVFAAKTNAEGRINSFIACTGEYNLNNAANKLVSASADGDNIAILVAGTYDVPTGKDLTITGAVDGVVFDMPQRYEGNIPVNASMTFNNVTFQYYNYLYVGLSYSNIMVYNNCVINGQVFLYGNKETFNNCTFNQNSSDAYNVWTYGAKEVAFNECTFNSAGKSVLVYNEGACATDLTVTDTKFIATATVDDKAAIEIDCSLMPKGTSIVIEGVDEGKTTATGFGENTKSGSSLWNDKKVVEGAPNGGTSSEVIIDDVVVKEPALMNLAGGGTEENPYLISNLEDLIWFRYQVNAGVNNYAGKHVKLAADINLESENWTPIGDITYDTKNNPYKPADNKKVFSGVFNGNDKVISNLKIERTVGGADTQANVGLFGITGEGAVIKDLTLTNVNIETDGRNVGALAGFAYKAILSNITVNGNIQIKGGNNVSGVAGMTRYFDMSATNIKVIGNDGSAIVGNNIVGGIFAEIAPNGSAQTFKNLSVENVAITGVSGVGGIVGLLTTGTVENVSVKNVALTGCTDYQGNAMGRIRLGSVAGLMGGKYATIANEVIDNVTAKNLDGNAVVLPIIGANYDASSNATEAKIGDTYYATLQIAIKEAEDGATITLIDDFSLTAQNAQELFKPAYNRESYCGIYIPDDKAIVLDLNGHTVSYVDTYGDIDNVMILNLGNLTINDENNKGKITYKPVAGASTYSKFYSTIFNCGTLTINGGTIENTCETETDVTNAVDNHSRLSHEYDNDCILTVNGGTLNGAYYYAIRQYTHYFEGVQNRVTINNGNINGGIYMQHGDSWYYADPNKNRLNVDCYLTINGGNIDYNTTPDKFGKIKSRLNNPDNNAFGLEITGGNINVPVELLVQRGYYYANGVSGETVPTEAAGTRNAEWLAKNGGFIEGGTFATVGDVNDVTSNLASFVAAGYQLKENVDSTYGVSLADYVTFPEGVTAENYKEKFGDNTVTDGTNYYATMTAALNAVYGTETTLYCKPGANVGQMTHGAIKETLTVYGNDAYTSGNGDFDIGNCNYEGKEITSDITLTVKHLDGCGAWGYKNTEHTINIVFENCKDMSEVYLSGTAGRTNITMTNCEFTDNVDGGNCKVYSNADGTITLKDMLFSGVDKAVNFNHKATGTQTIALENCTFTNCGDVVAGDEIPVRVLSSVAGGNSVLTVTDCTFSGTPEGGADILLDYGVGLTEATVSNTAAKVVVEKENNVGETTIVAANETKSFVNLVPVAKIGDAVYYTFEDAIAAAVADASITSIEILRDYTQTYYIEAGKIYSILENQNLTVVAPEGKSYTITLDRTAGETFSIYHKSAKSSLTIAENVTIEGLQILANGFATSENNTTINGTLKALSLKQWTSNGTITVSETGKVWLGYGDGQFDLAYGNGAVVINGNGDKTEPQFKAGYSGTRGDGNTLTLNNTYFEAGAWFNLDGTNGIVNINNSLLKVSGGDAAGKMTIKAGNVVYVNEGGTLECANITLEEGAKIVVNGGTLKAKTVTNNGEIAVLGESTLNIETHTGENIDFLDGAIVNNSTVGGEAFVAGNVTFRGANTFAMLYDYGTLTDYYGTTAPMKWNVEKGASVTLTNKARYGLGYGDEVTVIGNIENALTARENLSDDDRSLFMHGLVAQESSGWNCNSKLIVENAYVVLGSNNSFGNKPGNYGGNYTINFKNSVVDASRITFYEALSTTTFTFEGSDVKMGTFMTRDADSKFTLKDSKVLSTTTTNGTDEGNYNAGKLVLENSSLTYSAAVINTGTIEIGAASTLTAPAVTNEGTINFTALDSKLVTDTEGLTIKLDEAYPDHKVVYKDRAYVVVEKVYVAKIGEQGYESLAEAATAAQDGETIQLLWNEGDAAISMEGTVCGKTVTITGTANVDWSKGWFYVGRNGAADGKVIFDNANLTSVSNSSAYGINVSGRKKGSTDTYNGTVEFKNSTVVLDYLIQKNVMTLDKSTLTVKNGCSLTGRPANETESGELATSTTNLNNGSKLVVNGQNGMDLGYEGYGVLNIDATSTFEATENYGIAANGTMNVNGGNVKVAGTLTNNGTMVVAAESNVEVTGNLNVNGTLNSAGNITANIVKAATATIQLTGGIYTTEPQDGWCAESYGVFPYDENSWVVREISGEQTFELTASWNWVSSYITEFNDNGLAMLQQGLGTNGIQIKNNLKSSTYSNQTGKWNGSLTTTSVKEMYKVKVGELEEGMEYLQFNFEGSYVNYDECEIILYPGWNYIGYPVNVETNVADALVLLSADDQEEFNGPSVGDVLKSQQGAAIYFGIDNMPWMFDNQFNLIPGEGYMYHNTSGAVKILRYTTKNSSATTATNNRSSKYWTVDATQYSSNMTMIAMTDVEGGNYEVAAFVNGEVRGSSRPVYVESLDAYILILTISGDDVEEMTFRYYDITTGEEVEFSNRMNYSSDAVVGSIAEPYMLTRGTTGIGEAEMSQVNIYPNPTTTGTEINLQATCDKVEVFNALGAKVAEYQNVDSIDALETAGIYVIRITNDSNVQNCKLVVR